MAKSRSEIIGDIEDYIARSGANFAEWYVGVANSPKSALFGRHKVHQTGDAWIARMAKDEYEARDIAEYFTTTRRTKGSSGEAHPQDLYVYAYKRKSHTSP